VILLTIPPISTKRTTISHQEKTRNIALEMQVLAWYTMLMFNLVLVASLLAQEL
jgi:hypothetical protein